MGWGIKAGGEGNCCSRKGSRKGVKQVNTLRVEEIRQKKKNMTIKKTVARKRVHTCVCCHVTFYIQKT